MPTPAGRRGMPSRRLLLALLLPATAAWAGDYLPEGKAGLALLTGRSRPSAAKVIAEVRRRGFYAGDPIGAGDCDRCHADIAAQWASSAHRFASFNNPYYAQAVLALRREKGAAPSRLCGDCHDPFLTIDGSFDEDFPLATEQAQAGLTCLVCHSMQPPEDDRGNGRFLARLDPIPLKGPGHGRRLRPPLLAEARFCAVCHKVGLTEEVTGARWLRGQNEYDAWHDSAVAGQGPGAVRRPPETRSCQGCHMPLEPAPLGDEAAKNGLVRSHRFLGANTALPHLRGDPDHERRTVEFLRGAVSLDLRQASTGTVDVVLRNRRVGHRFPGGTMDSNEVWIEVVALGPGAVRLGWSGGLDRRRRLDPGAHRVRAQPVDGDGRPLGFRDVQHMRGVAYDASLGPADPLAVRYRLPPGTTTVAARLLYRKFDADYLAFACAQTKGEDLRRCTAPPIVELAAARATVDDGRLLQEARPDELDRLVDHGLALADGLAERAGEALPPLEAARALAPERPEPALGLARVAIALGRTDEALLILDRLDAQGPALLASQWLRATALHRAYRDRPALAVVERLADRLGDDRNVLGLLARLRGLAGDGGGALIAAERALQIDPEHEEGLFQRLLALRDLDRDDPAAAARYLRHRREIEVDVELRRRFAARYPALADEAIPVHTHELLPPR